MSCKRRLHYGLHANAACAKFMTHDCHPCGRMVMRSAATRLQKDKLLALKIKVLVFDLLRTMIGPIPGGGPCDAIIASFYLRVDCTAEREEACRRCGSIEKIAMAMLSMLFLSRRAIGGEKSTCRRPFSISFGRGARINSFTIDRQ